MRTIDPFFSSQKGINRVAFVELVARMKHNNASVDRIYTLNEVIAGQYLIEQYKKFVKRRDQAKEDARTATITNLQEQVKVLKEKCHRLESRQKKEYSIGRVSPSAADMRSSSPVLVDNSNSVVGKSHDMPLPIGSLSQTDLEATSVSGSKIFI